MTKDAVARMIDHTQLSPTAVPADIEKLCSEALRYHFASVCVNPLYVSAAADFLKNSDVQVCTVISFPLGADTPADKSAQAAQAVIRGAGEIDMVISIAAAREHRFDVVGQEIAGVVAACRKQGTLQGKKIIVKVILETCYLSDDEIASCCTCAVQSGADFVKTSTGFATPRSSDGKPLPNGATVSHVALMRKTVGSSCGVKASGGIRSAAAAAELIAAGADRLGTSSGITIVSEWKE